MTVDATPAPPLPTRLSSFVFAAKVAVLRLRRAAIEVRARPPRLAKGGGEMIAVAGVSDTALWSDDAPGEHALQLGKVQNLRVACRALDGLLIPAGALFSFWRNIGPPLAARGYARGRMLQQGCMVASTGGGLCQLSNALYEAALQAGCEIVERHPHSRVVPGSIAAEGRDATVAWNYVDLRFTADRALRLSARLDHDTLSVRLSGEAPAHSGMARSSAPWAPRSSARVARSCAACGETGCFRHAPAQRAALAGTDGRAFLVDEAWPEFSRYLQETGRRGDRLGLPLNGAGFGLARYTWPTSNFAHVTSAPLEALRRSRTLRRLGAQGAARRNAELDSAARIARRLARVLTPEVTAVTAAQSYLPFLWRDGVLGGREVTVLMTRLPMTALQDRLDTAAIQHPRYPTLSDFRAPAWLVRAEAEALADAAYIVTPHAQIAALFGARAIRLPWSTTAGEPRRSGPIRRIAFPGPTVARKGAHAVRDAAIALDLEVMPLGAELEGPEFWGCARLLAPGDWTEVDAFVQPALVEDQPRRLLVALAAGIPVFASEACGLDPQPGLVLVPPGDADALIAALKADLTFAAAGPSLRTSSISEQGGLHHG